MEKVLRDFPRGTKKPLRSRQNLYTKRSKALEHHFKRWKTTIKKTYIEHFSQTNWEKLTEHEKKQHSLANCKACDVHHFSYQSLFPLWGNKTKTVTREGIYKQINSRILKESSAGNVKVTKKALKSATKEVYDKLIQLLKRHLKCLLPLHKQAFLSLMFK